MNKFLLFALIIAFVGAVDIQERPPKIELTEQQKEAIKQIQVLVKDLAEKLAAGWQVDEVCRWIKTVGCAVGPVACEIAFPEFAWACAIGFGIICGL